MFNYKPRRTYKHCVLFQGSVPPFVSETEENCLNLSQDSCLPDEIQIWDFINTKKN